jgi:hypothetical protein
MSEEIEAVLSKQSAAISTLVHSQPISDAVILGNTKKGKTDKNSVTKMDKEWSEGGPLFRQVTGNACTTSLRTFRSANTGYLEIFITDRQGRNVCATNKTTDYYQADECWWSRTFERAETSHGAIEYDESAQSEAISLYVPVKNSGGRVIGVAKAVVDLESIKEAL